jgi:hypothetical protein
VHILKLREKLGLLSVLAQGVDPPAEVSRGRRGIAPRVLPPLKDGDQWQSFAAVKGLVDQQVSEWFSAELRKKGTTLEKLTPDERSAWSSQLRRQIDDGLREAHPAAPAYARLLETYRTNKATEFNEALSDFQSKCAPYISEGEESRVKAESFFNSFTPFYYSSRGYRGLLNRRRWHAPRFGSAG